MKSIPLNHLKIQTQEKPLASILLHYLTVLFACFTVALILSPFWSLNPGLVHTAAELVCIFIALAAFFVVWHNYKRTTPVNHLVGFGFLAVAIFDILHTYYFQGFNLFPAGFYDLNTRYWILGRLIEALVLLFTAFKAFQINVDKWVGGMATLALTVGIAGFVYHQPGLLPVLFTPDQGVTPAKVALEYLVIALFLAGAFTVSHRINDREHLTYRYIFLALLLAVPAELCFTVLRTLTDFCFSLGHVLKIAYYYYLFRGIFVSAVTWPYAKLEVAGGYMTEILNGIPVGILTYDNELKNTFANKKAEDILACRADDILGLTAQQLFARYNRNQDLTKSLAEQIMEENARPVIDKMLILENNQRKRIKVMAKAHRLENGGAMILITEARMEQELENLQLQTQTILDSIQDMVLLLDRESRIVMCNRALEKTLQVQAHDLRGLHINEFNELVRLVPHGITETGSHANIKETYCEATLVTAGGQAREVLISTAPIHNIDDEIIGFVNTCIDVDALKREQQKVRQREKLALLGQMAAGIVHEIKNPLTAISGFNQLIMAGTKEVKTKRYCEIINAEVKSINRVVSDFLSFAKPRPPKLKELSLNKLVYSMQPMLDSHLFTNGINGIFILEIEEEPVLADENQIRQVIMNMVKNATEALQETLDARLIISTFYNRDAREMSISISDNGKGIHPEDQHKLGTPFYTTKDKGTGLGLSICYQIVREHGGSIDLESMPGKGTTFTITLPVKSAATRITA